ncbi:PREDICTED: kinesin-like protein KIN-7F isoform X1 [Lupinus angustifolius]|uniref:kinesin-like protein KIN-7F isoform X1 n=1 Tax=Lupinus angustifolius TaxID=3871 RepID=UPI00092F2915|nr:PREDICTED: kinesin-like protein KIN-7F isoform X1 [Lupinus angustifolius]XP_019424226.1 PREDICTED: kinesin-like protein KIN-7F isoform X1 [Lupinus angustifolius]XP_019424227.1 PREDICTED: kinesin-like protein KIN-7F isoform X1 [Lupinus angustifolius]
MGSIGGEEAMQQGHEERILVSVRLRPMNDKELARNDVSDWECINDTTIICRNNLSTSDRSLYPTAYSFDRVFRGDCSTRHVYEAAAKEVAVSVVSGINSSIFAYGQTSSGKTYTMSGITEYAVADIFNYIEKHPEREFVSKFSAIEIYNESVRDLLSADSTPLRLLDDPERGTVIEKLTEEAVRDRNHLTELIAFCENQRQIGETTMNDASSRSHQILRLTIESSALEFHGNDKSSSLAASVNFVDLAGSERVSQTNSAGTRLKEGCHINRSLLTLGTVIRKLSKGRNGHIPFRDSKLTRILQSSLGGNAKTAIICTMSPARSHVEQTRNTLLFASCAKEVATSAQVNVVVSDKALVKQLQKEVSRLETELRISATPHPISDSTALLREKDREIEMLKKEVRELMLKLDRAQSQMKDMAQVAEDDVPHLQESMDLQYPRLRVRNTWDFENQSDEPNILSDGVESIRSFHASQYSDGHSISSDENLFQLPDLEKNLPIRIASPGISIASTDAVSNDLDQKSVDDEHEGEHCKDVRCIESEDMIANTHTHSNQADLSPKNTYTNSNTANFRLTVVDNGDKKNMDLSPSELKEDKKLDHSRQGFALPSTETISPWMSRYSSFSCKTLKLSRSRSCKGSLMKSSSSDWFDMEEIMQNTPEMGDEKDFSIRPGGFQRKVYTLNYNANVERKSLDSYINFVGGAQIAESSTNKETESNGPNGNAKENGSFNLVADNEVTETGLNPIMSTKNFKDVGLDPMQADGENHSDWPSEFKRLQGEIIELWDACNISLIHRTYFFLLFKGDPSDSIYMEVELRRLSYIKQTFSQGNQIVESGHTLTPESSMKNLRRERQMLSKQILRRLSKSERENLYLKWGLRLSSKHRRLQLTHRLWTDTKDIDHVRESAAIVAKLVDLVEPHQVLKEMFGLNFAPRPISRKYFGWTASMKNILL